VVLGSVGGGIKIDVLVRRCNNLKRSEQVLKHWYYLIDRTKSTTYVATFEALGSVFERLERVDNLRSATSLPDLIYAGASELVASRYCVRVGRCDCVDMVAGVGVVEASSALKSAVKRVPPRDDRLNRL
jgi:hypothetical protein